MSGYQYINLDYIKELADGDLEFLSEMISMYIVQIPAYLKDLNEAAESGSVSDIKFFAHKLASSFTIMGANQLNEAALHIEHNIEKEMTTLSVKAKLTFMENLFIHVVDELNLELKQLNPSNSN